MAIAQQMEQEATAQRDSAKLAEAYYLYGKAYNAKGNYLLSQQYYTKALRILDKRGDSYELGQVYLRLSDNEAEQSHTEKSLVYTRMAKDIFERIGADKGVMTTNGYFARVYVQQWVSQFNKDPQHPFYDSVWYYHRASEKIAYKLQDSLAIAESSLALGDLYTYERNLPKALEYIERARRIFAAKQRIFELSSTYITLTNCYLRFGEPRKAYEALQAGEQVYGKMTSEPKMDRNFLEAYMDCYKAMNDPYKALEYAEKLRALENKILLTDHAGTISRLNIAYETEKKDAQIKNQQRELQLRVESERNQRLAIWVSVCLLLSALAASMAFYRLYRRSQRISQQNELLVKEQNHRVKNNLQVISSLLNLQARRLTDETAQKTMRESQLRIESMAILHRKLYEGEQIAQVNLAEYIPELVENVERSFGQIPVERQLEIDSVHVEADKATLVGLILTEVLTNAWKYAFEKVAAPSLRIGVAQQESKIRLTVADNGPGWDDIEVSGKSLGMRIIKAQAAQLNAEYGFETNNGTLFWLKFRS